MNKARCLRLMPGLLAQPRIERTALGALIVTGILLPSGEHFAATLNAVSAIPGGAFREKVIYTDRGAYRTGLDNYSFASAWV